MIFRIEPRRLINIFYIGLSFEIKQVNELFFSFCQAVCQVGWIVSQQVNLVIDFQ